MEGIWNRYNLKSTRRIYTFVVLKCSEMFNVLDLSQYISTCAPFVALETSKPNSISCHVFWIMSRVTVSMADVVLSCRCWIYLIFSAYTMFLMYPHRKKSSGERSGLRGGVLNERSFDAWIGRNGPIPWTPRSPDLSPLDFFLWGYIKNTVCAEKIRNIQHLQERITSAIETVTRDMIQKNVAGDRISFGRLQSYKRCTYWNVLR